MLSITQDNEFGHRLKPVTLISKRSGMSRRNDGLMFYPSTVVFTVVMLARRHFCGGLKITYLEVGSRTDRRIVHDGNWTARCVIASSDRAMCDYTFDD